MTVDDLKKKKEEAGMTTAALSKLSGVPVGTINKILNGETKSPRCDTLSALEQALDSAGKFSDKKLSDKKISVQKTSEQRFSQIVRESGASYGVEEPDVRTELMDGEWICPGSPTVGHQVLISQLVLQLERFIEDQHGSCLVLPAPFHIYPDGDQKTVLQPDLSVVCDRERLCRDGLMGAPDLVMEITSSFTRRRDLGRKMCRYQEAGVREYWVLDIKTRKILVYCFEQDELPAVYSFEDEIPVSIWEGKLRICLQKAAVVLGELGE